MNIIFVILFLIFASNVQGNVITQKLNERMIQNDTLLCVGLDPDPSKMPLEILSLDRPIEEKVYLFLTKVIDLTSKHVCAYKLQKAFYDDFSDGHILLERVVSYIKHNHREIPVFIDCKIGDTENTMNVYMHNLFEQIKGDGIVVNPYMGDDVFIPFCQDPEKTALVMVQTSNPSAKVVQELRLSSGEFLWERVLDLTLHRWNKHQNLILILSSNTEGYDYKEIRKAIPQEVPILLAGIGAQGGDLSVLRDLLDENGVGVFINSSRGILYPYSNDSNQWKELVLKETILLKEQINKIRYENI